MPNPKEHFSYYGLIADSFRLMKKDWMIMVPYMIYFFAVQVFQTQFPKLASENANGMMLFIQLVVFGWVLTMFFKGLTLIIAKEMVESKILHIKNALGEAFSYYLKLLIGSGILLAPIAVLAFLMQGEIQGVMAAVFVILVFVVAVPLSFVLQFFPVVMIENKKGIKESIMSSLKFVKDRKWPVVFLISFILLISAVSLIVSYSLTDIPVLGRGVLFVVVQSFSATLVTVMTLIFYKVFRCEIVVSNT